MFSKYEGIDDITLLSRNMLGKSMTGVYRGIDFFC